MAIRGLTNEEHRYVLEKLVSIGRSVEGVKFHPAGPEYTSLMVCFLMHNLSSAESVLRLHDVFKDEYFPATVGYTIVRTMFEIEVTAHYLTRDPIPRARQYIEYQSVLEKRQMEAWKKHRRSKKPDWREAMETAWQHEWIPRQKSIDSKYDSVAMKFQRQTSKGKLVLFSNWTGKSLREMAVEADHEEAYDVFYSDLSSFTHADVRLANRFLRINSEGISWSQRARWLDIGGVFRYADIFLDCFLKLFGHEFSVWSKDQVEKCWEQPKKSSQ